MMKKEIGLVCKPMIKGTPNGDAYFIKKFDNKMLVAVIDGEGHGENASISTNSLIGILKQDFNQYLSDIMKRFHATLNTRTIYSRKAVAALCLISDHDLVFCGVGNIDVRVIGGKTHPFSMPGLLGKKITNIVEQKYDYAKNEIIIMHSDGISGKFSSDDLPLDNTAQEITEFIDRNYSKQRDDQTVIVIK